MKFPFTIKRAARVLPGLLLFVALQGRPAAAQSVPPAMDPDVGFDQRLSAGLPLETTFVDQSGKSVRLGDYFGEKPVVLTPVYYQCPMLCGLELNGLVRCLRGLEMSSGMVAGRDFTVVTYTIDHREPASLAAQKRKQYLAQYGAESAAEGWHFLTGDEAAIQALNRALGFRAKYDPVSGQYNHAAGIVVATPRGVISRYLYGVEFAPKDLRLSILESQEEKVGSLADHVLLFCFRYDPTQGKYGLAILNLLRAAGSVTVVLLAGYIVLMLRRERVARPALELEGGAHA